MRDNDSRYGRRRDISGYYCQLCFVPQTPSSSTTPTSWSEERTVSSLPTNSTEKESLTSYLPCQKQGSSKYFIKSDISFRLKYSREDQLILIKSVGVWNGNNTKIVLPRKHFYHIGHGYSIIYVVYSLYFILYETLISGLIEDCIFPRHKSP